MATYLTARSIFTCANSSSVRHVCNSPSSHPSNFVHDPRLELEIAVLRAMIIITECRSRLDWLTRRGRRAVLLFVMGDPHRLFCNDNQSSDPRFRCNPTPFWVCLPTSLFLRIFYVFTRLISKATLLVITPVAPYSIVVINLISQHTTVAHCSHAQYVANVCSNALFV